ncbi:MAG: PAS domain S-box protein, partial [Deltaproteobacteria bacterium]|nr:PAS domain S-box protein [Deltaproteobacteria bacterium]
MRERTRPLKESEAKYRALVTHSLTGIIIVTSGEIRFANQTFEQITGYTQEDIKTMSPWDMVHPSERESIRQMGMDRLEKRPIREIYETRWICKDGREIWVEVRATPIKDRGDPAVLANVVDITARKRAEEQLRHRLQMETMITSISTNFINLASDAFDREINQALRRIGEFCGFDRGYVFRFSENKKRMTITHEWLAENRNRRGKWFREVSGQAWPWGMERLEQFQNFIVPRTSDLPLEARAEREMLESQGILSLIAVPMTCGGSLVGFLGFDSVTQDKESVADNAATLKIAGQIFVNALERKRVEEALRNREEELEFQAQNLEEANTALKVLLKRREEDQRELEEKVLSNVKDLVVPFVDQLRNSRLDSKQSAFLGVIESNLNQITSPFSKNLSAQFMNLTPKEIQIANLIK